MQDTLTFILKNIVTTPDDVSVVESVDETGTTNYSITVNPEDVGRIIGKEGKVIKAIRTIMRVIAIQKGVHVRISVVSDNFPNTSSEATTPVVEADSGDSLNVEV
jgi:uncharacterized protein